MSGHCHFPPLNGPVDCTQCEAENCRCHGRHQRNRRDLSYTSGRCPRLPDLRGGMEPETRSAYAETFMLIHAELSEGSLELNVTIPEFKQYRKVYQTTGISAQKVRRDIQPGRLCTLAGFTP